MLTQVEAHWRDSSRTPRFFVIDAYATLPLLFFLIHIKWWTFWLAISAMIFFGILERFGYSVPVFRRVVRTYLSGKHRFVRVWWKL